MALKDRLETTTYDEYARVADAPENAERRLELVDGRIVEKAMPTEEHGTIVGNIYLALASFVNPRKLGRVALEVRYRRPDDLHNARQPDLSFTSGSRPWVTKGSTPVYPDLAVEVQSPDDRLSALYDKASFYLANGTRLVWIVLPAKRLIQTFAPGETQILTDEDVLTGGEVLPGFEVPVRHMFADPASEG